MTGYGVARKQTDRAHFEVSLKTVNGRFFETRFHLPREFSFLEPELKKIVSQYFQRGTVDVFVNRKLQGKASSLQAHLREGMANEWLIAAIKLKKNLKLKGSIDISTILRIPDLIYFEENKSSFDTDVKEIKKLLEKACKNCVEEREREGDSLRLEMLKILSLLSDNVEKLFQIREQANKEIEERVKAKLKARLADIQLDQNRILQEVIFQIEKADINEELQRLGEHLKTYKNLLESPLAEGKKLDFYTQELLREMNTVGSKSQLSVITQWVVEGKTNIERLREQVQNIE
jgi:uncharacterized protein (TIGR00255 family)